MSRRFKWLSSAKQQAKITASALSTKFRPNTKQVRATAIALLLICGTGGVVYWLFQSMELRQQIRELKRPIEALPSKPTDKDRFALERDRIALKKDRIALENVINGSIVQTLGGLLLIVTAYVSWQNLKATQEKQITERYTQAINQLGSCKIEVRFGGVYALERIAKDSPKDHWTIMEVLTSFVQEKSPQLTDGVQSEDSDQSGEQHADEIPKDVQAALTVIGRRSVERDQDFLDLAVSNLSGAKLSEAKLSGAYLMRAKLSGALLSGAILSRAKLIGAKLIRAYLNEAHLDGADLSGADLSEALLSRADLSGAILFEAHLSGAHFFGANLSGAILSRADLSGAKLSRAHLNRANLIGASLVEADLSRAHLNRASLNGADLSGASLVEADLFGADLFGADLSGVDLYGANLSGVNLHGADLFVANLTNARNLNVDQIKLARNWDEAKYDEDLRQQLFATTPESEQKSSDG